MAPTIQIFSQLSSPSPYTYTQCVYMAIILLKSVTTITHTQLRTSSICKDKIASSLLLFKILIFRISQLSKKSKRNYYCLECEFEG